MTEVDYAAADGPTDQAAAPVLTASQQAAAEMDEFERQLALGDDPPAGGADGSAAPGGCPAAAAADGQPAAAARVITASQQLAAEMDDFERRLALGDDPPAAEDRLETGAGPQTAAAAVTASQQATVEMNDFERGLALGDDASPATAGPAPATASQRAADAPHQQAGDETPSADGGSPAVTVLQQAAADADELEGQLANGEAQSAEGRLPGVTIAASQPAVDADAVQRQLTSGECVPQTATPSVSAAVVSKDKLTLRATEGELASDAGPPAAKRARTSVDGSAYSAPDGTDVPGHSLARNDDVQRGNQRASHTVSSSHHKDAGSDAREGAAAIQDNHGDEDDEMDLADMDDEELLRLVMTQAEDEAARE